MATTTDGPGGRAVGQRDRGQHASPRASRRRRPPRPPRHRRRARTRTPRRGPCPSAARDRRDRRDEQERQVARRRVPERHLAARRHERREPPAAQDVRAFAPRITSHPPSAGTKGPDGLVRREREVMGEDRRPGPGPVEHGAEVPSRRRRREGDGLVRLHDARPRTARRTRARSRPGTSATRRRARPGRAPPTGVRAPTTPTTTPRPTHPPAPRGRTGTRAPATGTTRRRTPPLTNDPSSTGSSNRTRSATSTTGGA